MIAHPRPKRDQASVIRRATIARAAMTAKVPLDKKQLAAELGISRGQLNNYLAGRVKAAANLPRWAEKLFAGCAALGQHNELAAAASFRELAEDLSTMGDPGEP